MKRMKLISSAPVSKTYYYYYYYYYGLYPKI